jgi:hypothetical protein
MNKMLIGGNVSTVIPQECTETDLLKRHDIYFETRAADTQQLIESVYKIRYRYTVSNANLKTPTSMSKDSRWTSMTSARSRAF